MLTQEQYKLEKNADYGFLQIKPTPTPEEIAEYYAKEFYSSGYKQVNNSSLEIQDRDKAYNDAHRDDMYNELTALLGGSLENKKILDFGCGWAQTLQYFKAKGADCYGCDPAIEAVQYARSQDLNVVQTKIDTLNVFGDQKFDVVLLLNVLEHLADPINTVVEIRKNILKPNGIFVIEVPNDFNIFQECAVKMHDVKPWWVAPPAHLNYFNRQSLTTLLTKNGFHVEKVLGSFPLEMFLLFGDCYIGNPELGRACHEKRVSFELNLKKHGYQKELNQLFETLGQLNLGRQILTYARNI